MSTKSAYGDGELSSRGIFGPPPRRKKPKKLGCGSEYRRLQSKKQKNKRATWMEWPGRKK